ncbi:S24 family peptidase [Isobaculum melis]|uniref:Peptidase S24-like n=1 Tax=Isobaculum melis TaxID=142588 RepID=A0A1H9QE57_9LACT|nr:S24 family peptidase [Isobaculum melis]SER58465.1 Peptidase S24-like [Isobaculum melis]
MRSIEAMNRLRAGETIFRYREAGNSMLPLIRSMQPVTLEPIQDVELKVGDIVFCKVRGNFYTHKISKVRGKQYQISNNHRHVNGWVTRNSIYGIVTKILEK